MLHIAVCDDETIWLEETVNLLKKYLDVHSDISVKIHTFSSGLELLEYTERNHGFDLYILDIVMPGMNGIETGVALRKQQEKGMLVYLTTSKEFALDSFETNPYYYLVKPVKEEQFFSVFEKAFRILNDRQGKAISLKTKDGVKRILFDDIVYVELVNRSACYYLKDGQSVKGNQQRISFAEMMLPLLQDRRFCRCGASFVVNLYHVKGINKDEVHFLNGKKLFDLPKMACATVLTQWLDYWVEGEIRL